MEFHELDPKDLFAINGLTSLSASTDVPQSQGQVSRKGWMKDVDFLKGRDKGSKIPDDD